MDLNIEQSLIADAKQHVADKTTSLGDEEYKADISRYLDQGRFDQEMQKIFRRLPSALIHRSELSEPDSYQAIETPLGGLIVSRDHEGKSHVFYNSCRHRGARIAEGKVCKKRMVCPYHAWSYTTDGKLHSLPGQSHCFPNLDKADNGLLRIPSVEKYGFIWACPTADSQEQAEATLDAHLGGMVSHLQWLNADALTFFQRTVRVWKGNWKLFVEGGLETYHFAFAHRETIAPSFYNNIAVIDQVDEHFRVVMPTRELETGPAQSLHDCSHTLFSLLPNTAILVQKEHADWIQSRPLSPTETEITITSIIPSEADLADQKQQQHWAKNHHITNVTLNEDWALGESIQASLNTRALPYLQYGKNEWALHAFNQVLDGYLAKE